MANQHIPTVTLNNGITMPQIGFGVFQVPDDQATAAVTTALEVGYRSIDTAAIYDNEQGVGRAIAESGLPRNELFITTKLWNADQGYDSTLEAFDQSLHKLGLEYLDLYLVHWPTPRRDLYLETWRAFEKLHSDGRIRAIGISNFEPAHIDRLVASGNIPPAVNQVELHPALQNRATVAANRRHEVVTEAWSPLAHGEILEDPLLADLAAKHDRSPAQVVLRWHLQQGRVIIPKSVTPSRIAENFDIFGFQLSDVELAAIDTLERDGRTGPHPTELN